jgi:hypothetical protein
MVSSAIRRVTSAVSATKKRPLWAFMSNRRDRRERARSHSSMSVREGFTKTGHPAPAAQPQRRLTIARPLDGRRHRDPSVRRNVTREDRRRDNKVAGSIATTFPRICRGSIGASADRLASPRAMTTVPPSRRASTATTRWTIGRSVWLNRMMSPGRMPAGSAGPTVSRSPSRIVGDMLCPLARKRTRCPLRSSCALTPRNTVPRGCADFIPVISRSALLPAA